MKEKKLDPLDPQTVFKISHADIKKTGKTQCQMKDHVFRDLNENEVVCDKCNSIYIIK